MAPLSSNPATRYSLDSQCYEYLVALSARELVLYDALAEKLKENDTAFSSHLTLSLESYLHPNTTDFTTEDDWVYSYLDRQPLLSIPLEISLGNFYGVMDFIAANSNVDGYADGKIYFPTSELFGEKSFTINIPYRAFLAVGGTGWLFQLGRDRLSWGPGMSGNFMIGDQVQYHNMGRLTAYRDNFKYTFLTRSFLIQMKYLPNLKQSKQDRL